MKQGKSQPSTPLFKTGCMWKAVVLHFGVRGFPQGQVLQLFELLAELATFFHGPLEKNN